MPQKDPCQKQACAIQHCLQANKYVESMCQDVIRDMRRCCEARNSICCSGFKDSKPTENQKRHLSPGAGTPRPNPKPLLRPYPSVTE